MRRDLSLVNVVFLVKRNPGGRGILGILQGRVRWVGQENGGGGGERCAESAFTFMYGVRLALISWCQSDHDAFIS